MKINKPKISKYECKDIEEIISEEQVCNYKFCNNSKDKIELSDTTIDSCIFEKVDFSNIELKDVDLVDVIFDGCDLSNKRINNINSPKAHVLNHYPQGLVHKESTNITHILLYRII